MFSYLSDGKAFTRRPGRESTWRSERISSGGISRNSRRECWKSSNITFMLVLARFPYFTFILHLFSSLFIFSLCSLLPGWKLVSQGALAVLKQFLESNLVRTFHISEHLMCLPLVCAQSNLIFSRNTWATNLPISVASWKHTGAVTVKCSASVRLGWHYYFRQKSRSGAGNTNGAPQQVGRRY